MKRMWSKNELKQQADARIEALVEGGTLDNAKPIYCHPINFKFASGDRLYFLSCLIFNNDDEPFTASTWYDYVMNLITEYSAIIMCSGAMWDGTNAWALIATNISSNGSDGMAVRGLVSSTGAENYYTIVKSDLTGGTFTDGVNKIN